MSTSILSNKIKKARIEANLSQKELGQAIKISEKSISAYESNRATPPIGILGKLAKETKKPIWYFTESEDIELSVMSKLLEIEKQISELKDILSKTQNS